MPRVGTAPTLARWKAEGRTLCELRLFECTSAATTRDHIVPLSRGGTNWPANLRPACESCNRRKGSRLDSELTKYDFPMGRTRKSA